MSENIDNERGQTFTAQKPMTDPPANDAKLLPEYGLSDPLISEQVSLSRQYIEAVERGDISASESVLLRCKVIVVLAAKLKECLSGG